MEKRTFLATGALILLAGLVLISIGAHKIVSNLPLSQERTLREAEAALWLHQGGAEEPREALEGGSVEVQIWLRTGDDQQSTSSEKSGGGGVSPGRAHPRHLGGHSALQHPNHPEFVKP